MMTIEICDNRGTGNIFERGNSLNIWTYRKRNETEGEHAPKYSSKNAKF